MDSSEQMEQTSHFFYCPNVSCFVGRLEVRRAPKNDTALTSVRVELTQLP